MSPTSRSKSFRALSKEWDKKLLESGFIDCEYRNGTLKQHDTRTALCENWESVLVFFNALDEYLANNRLPKLHRRILELYSDGKMQTDIAKTVKRGRTTVKNIIREYRKKIIG